MNAPLRVIPPAPAQLAADPGAPHVVLAALDEERVALAASDLGLDVGAWDGLVRVVASGEGLARLATSLEGAGSDVATPLRRYLEPVAVWELRTRALPLDVPHVMGIVNLTEDSFSGDGVGADLGAALRRAEELREAGAAIVDVGGETARADRPVLDAEAEARLVAPVVRALAREGHIVSADTYKALVARAALDEGAEVINDISGLTLGLGAAQEAAAAGAGYVLNYSFSVPKRRPDTPPEYLDVVAETIAWMWARLARLEEAGMERARIAVDPGVAFGKSHDEDLQVLRRLGELTTLGQPILLAHSRKNFIGSVTGRSPADRDLETHVASALAYAQGARIFRVHDAAGARRALEMAAALATAAPGRFAPDGESWPWRAGSSAAHMTKSAPDKPAPAGQRW